MTLAWPADMPRCLDYPTTGIDAVLAGAARAYPDRIALQDGDLELTFAELYDRAQRAAGDCVHSGSSRGTWWRSIWRTTCGTSWPTTGRCVRVLLWRRSIRLSRPPVSTISWMM